MSSDKKIKYLLDSNVLIGFALWKPISLELNEFFWDELSRLLKKEKWLLLDCVVHEIEKSYDKDFRKWCEQQVKDGLVCKNTEEDKKRAIAINNKYKMINEISGKSEIDTYLLAFAERNGVGIFSRETKRSLEGELYKIPDICGILGIEFTKSPKAFLKSLGF